MMWRTSWLSREVIVLPAFIAVVALWWLALRVGAPRRARRGLLPLVALVVAALLWYCTAMIYACLRFIEEWAHPLTLGQLRADRPLLGHRARGRAGRIGG